MAGRDRHPLVYWSFSGLESSLAALLALLLVGEYAEHLERRVRVLPGARIAGVTLLFLAVRPETVFVLGGALAGLSVLVGVHGRIRPGAASPFGRRPQAKLAGLAGVAGLAFLAIAAFRLVYFGSLFPQPVSAKSFSRIAAGGFAAQVAAGGDYLVEHTGTIFLAAFWVGLLAAGVVVRSLLRGERARSFDLLGACFCAAYLAFVVTTGGDYMEGARYVVPFLPVALVLACALLHRELPPSVSRPLVAALAVIQLAGTLQFARSESTGIPLGQWLAEDFEYSHDQFAWTEAANRVHRRDLELAERLPAIVARLHGDTGRPVTVLSRQMGMVPYHLAYRQPRAVRFIDAYGLATRDITSDAFAPMLPQWRRSRFLTLFREPDAIEEAWGVARPDVIYDLRDPPERLLEENGYTVVFRQSGRVGSPSRLFPGSEVGAGAWIAVRDDLLPGIRISRSDRPEG